MHDLEKLEGFAHLIHLLHATERVARTPGADRAANVAEHTFQVALFSWYIMDSLELTLDREKVLMYALAHDVIEAYAGDTYIYDKAAQKTKEKREADAFARIRDTFSEFPSLIDAIEKYERREDEESKFVYAVDKLVDPLNIAMEEGRSLWKEHGVSYDDIRSYKDAKISISKDVEPYWHLLIEKIERNRGAYFDR